jgi:hypothetical protein
VVLPSAWTIRSVTFVDCSADQLAGARLATALCSGLRSCAPVPSRVTTGNYRLVVAAQGKEMLLTMSFWSAT